MFYALFMGIMGAIALPWMFQQEFSKKAFEKRKAAFAEGKGKDPEKDFVGPHKTFKQNALPCGAIFFAVGLGVSIATGL
ncbi:hypothetical protein ACRAQ7_03875 [Erythrobacter sp. W53]|uniref:hypothetical protein n=1 Tax=Erythrobacter sp. W53 TaxID=3425947 RepID=UPI003D767AA2